MYYEARKMTDFYPVTPPADLRDLSVKYTVFRVVTFDERMEAIGLLNRAEKALRERSRAEALRLLKKSLNLDPCSPEARRLFRRLCGRMPRIGLKDVQ